MHTKGKLQFLLSEVLNRSADFAMSFTWRREAAGGGKSEVSHTRRSSKRTAKKVSLPGLLRRAGVWALVTSFDNPPGGGRDDKRSGQVSY